MVQGQTKVQIFSRSTLSLAEFDVFSLCLLDNYDLLVQRRAVSRGTGREGDLRR